MNIEDIPAELREKAIACKTPEELAALAKENGIELTDEQLESLSGGVDWLDCEVDSCPAYRYW